MCVHTCAKHQTLWGPTVSVCVRARAPSLRHCGPPSPKAKIFYHPLAHRSEVIPQTEPALIPSPPPAGPGRAPGFSLKLVREQSRPWAFGSFFITAGFTG